MLKALLVRMAKTMKHRRINRKNRALNRKAYQNKQYLTKMGCKELNEIVCVNDIQVCEQVIRIQVIGIWSVSWVQASLCLRVCPGKGAGEGAAVRGSLCLRV